MIIPIASDHAGFKAKKLTKQILEDLGHEPLDFGTHSEESVDYPDYAVHVSEKVNKGDYDQGILLCGSGQGVCMTANKYPKIRAALVFDKEATKMTRLHNNANVLCLPGRTLEDNPGELKAILETWFSTEFEGGRHNRRVTKIESLTQKEADQ